MLMTVIIFLHFVYTKSLSIHDHTNALHPSGNEVTKHHDS